MMYNECVGRHQSSLIKKIPGISSRTVIGERLLECSIEWKYREEAEWKDPKAALGESSEVETDIKSGESAGSDSDTSGSGDS